MDEFELRRIIYDYVKEICHYSQMQVFSTSSYQRNYFQIQIDEAINGLINFLIEREELLKQQNDLAQQVKMFVQMEPQPTGGNAQRNPSTTVDNLNEITMEELAYNDGSGGKPAYVAVNGKVYDATREVTWAGGTHFGLYAGKDLTKEFNACHKAMYEILEILPVIGMLKK